MNLTFDIGNTRIKWAQFDGSTLVRDGVLLPSQLTEEVIQSICSSATVERTLGVLSGSLPPMLNNLPLLSSTTSLPISIDYDSRQTLGADRIASAVGAFSQVSPYTPALIIDAGTCITIDLLSADGVFQGGAILPGLSMQFQALHDRTAALPYIALDKCAEWHGGVLGRSTVQSLMVGVITATRFSVEQFIVHHRAANPGLRLFLTGGDAALLLPSVTPCPHLSLMGLNTILNLK